MSETLIYDPNVAAESAADVQKVTRLQAEHEKNLKDKRLVSIAANLAKLTFGERFTHRNAIKQAQQHAKSIDYRYALPSQSEQALKDARQQGRELRESHMDFKNGIDQVQENATIEATVAGKAPVTAEGLYEQIQPYIRPVESIDQMGQDTTQPHVPQQSQK